MLKTLKLFHTIIWAIMTAANFLAFYLALVGRYNLWFWIPVSLLLIETAIIIFNKWKCPLTNVAERLTAERQANFDIYLPLWLAKYNKEIFTVLIILEIVFVLIYRFA